MIKLCTSDLLDLLITTKNKENLSIFISSHCFSVTDVLSQLLFVLSTTVTVSVTEIGCHPLLLCQYQEHGLLKSQNTQTLITRPLQTNDRL